MKRLIFALLITVIGLGGISRQANADGAWQSFTTADGLPTNTILALAGEWAGTTAGVARRDARGWIAVTESGAPTDWVTAILVDARGRLWCGTYGQGVYVREGSLWRAYRQSDSGLPGDWITALALGAPDEIYVATLGGGLGHFDGQSWVSFRPDASPLPSPWLTALAVDQRGALWIGAMDKGLASYYQGRWQRYRAADSGLLSDEITALVVAADGRLWIGTTEGVCVLTPATGEWQRWPGNWNLPHPHVRALAADRQGSVWVGTSQGIALYQNDAWSNLPTGVLATISALSVDESGQLEAGTLGGGVWRYGAEQQAPRAPKPILLVHGWRGPDSDRIEDSEFAFLRRWLEQDGFVVFYATGIDPLNTLHENAARLRDNIARVKQATGAEQVDIIAFSMGGLNSRAYLESSLYAGDVGQIIIMGTPHAGVQLWKTFLLHEIAQWTDEPSARELLPEHVALFNETHGNSWQVPYTLVAGDVQADLLPSLFGFMPPSDGLISAWSAHALRGSTVRYVTTPDLHAWSDETMALGIPSFLWPGDTYRRYLRPLLQRPDRAIAVETAPPSWQALPSENHSPLLSGQIAAKQTITRSLELDAAGTTRIYARWQSGEIDVSLINPRGERITPDTTGNSAAYFALPLANFASYILTDTLPGTWTLELINRNSTAVGYVTYALLDSALRLETAPDKPWYAAGEPVILRATLRDAGRTVAGATVAATIYSAVGQGQTLTLYDDGQHQDGLSGDGVYGNVWQPVGAGGYYPYFVSAVGNRAGKPYARGSEGVLVISTGAARLGDALPDKAVDEGGDWVYECLTLPVRVEVARAGEFLISARLADLEGREIATVALPIALGPGRQMVTLRFPGEPIARHGVDGAYRVERILLLDISGAAVKLDEGRAVLTADYCAGDFGH